MTASTYFRATLIAGVALIAVPAFAQNSAEGEAQAAQTATGSQSSGISDIVVTAQRRQESVQKTALAIEVLSGDTIQQRGVLSASDLTKVATGIQASAGGFNQIYVRGVGDFGVTIAANPAVVTNLNGVPITRPQAIAGNFFDLERVEVLKGPQGTLYGRNATGGVINLIAARPKLGVTSGYVSGQYGNYNALQGEAAINLPIGSNLAVRLSGQIGDRDGYLTDGRDDDKHQSVRFQTYFESGALSANLRASYLHLGGNGAGLAVVPTIPGESKFLGTISKASSDYFIGLADANFAASGGTSPPSSILARQDTFDPKQDVDSFAIDGQIDYDFGGATLTIIPAYRWTHAKFGLGLSYFYTSGGNGTDGDRSDYYSLEARLGNSGDKLKWVVGVFGLKEDQSSDFFVDAGLIQRIRIGSKLNTKAGAIFGEATYSLSDALRLTVGGRYTSDKREASDLRYVAVSPTVTGNPPCLPDLGFPAGTECSVLPPGSFNSAKTFKRATWRAGMEYDIAPQSMFFANVATGFKAGGFNQAVDPENTSRVLAFEPEKITAYTVGLRNRFASNTIQFNVEGFYWDYKDLQLSQVIIDGFGNLAAATQNAGSARIYGFNVDAIIRPTSTTTIRGSIEYLNAKYKSFQYEQAEVLSPPGSVGCPVSPSNLPAGPLGPFVSIDCSGYPLNRAPKWSGNVGISQILHLANGGNFTFDGDLNFASKRYVSNTYTANSLAKAYGILSASITYNGPNEQWSIGAFVRNITNTLAYVGGGEQSPYVPQYLTSAVQPPRTYGIRARVNF